ncbi:MAG: DUF4401 domain-containing protein, partial [Dongiaceae bacterium]
YVQIVTGLGGWISALLIVAFVMVSIHLTIGDDDIGLPITVIGFVLYVAALALTRFWPGGLFRHHFVGALAAAGAIAAALGAAIAFEEVWPGVIVALPLAALTAWFCRDRILQFLVTGAAALWLVVWLVSDDTAYLLDILSLPTLLGALLYLWPPPRDVRGTALVLLLTLPVAAILFDYSEAAILIGEIGRGGWVARAVHLLLFLALLWRYQQSRGAASAMTETVAFAIAAVLISLLLPPGGSAALLLMMLAFVAGSRPLALIGAGFQAYFLWRFYYDLNATLLEKSLLLAGTGVALLLLYGWWELARRRRIAQ